MMIWMILHILSTVGNDRSKTTLKLAFEIGRQDTLPDSFTNLLHRPETATS